MVCVKKTLKATWEDFDAEDLFPPPQLHSNLLTKVDKKDLNKVDQDELGEQFPQSSSSDSSEEQNEPQDGDTYTDAPIEKNHTDQLYEMEGLEGSTQDDREVKADKEEDQRTQPEEDEQTESGNTKEDGESDQFSDEKEKSEPTDEDGADNPIQKEEEGIDEVTEATSKTSEDVHGGDEATKDIEGSPNAADDGMNEENQGAESGKDGQDGDGNEGDGEKQEDSDAGNSSSLDGQIPQAEADQPQDASVSDPEDWEPEADKSVWNSQRLYEELAEVAAVRPSSSAGGGAAVDYSGENWNESDLCAIFFKTRELIKKLLSEEDFTRRQQGYAHWWAKELAKNVVRFKHERIPAAKFDRPKENNIVFFMDVSGSVSSLAEIFMAIMGGAAGLPGVRIVVGSEAHAENEIVVQKPFKSVEKAIDFFRNSVNAHVCDDPYCESCKGKIRNTGWVRPYDHPFEPGIFQYLRDNSLLNQSTTCIFFGDMQGVHFNTPELRKLNRTCKCLWLFTDEPGHYTHTDDLPKAIKAGLPIVYNVNNARSFAKAVRRFQGIRPGMQIKT